jgi:protein gp37
MGGPGMTSIEWTEATWNPIAGCTVHSPGCTNCYAMRTAARLATIPATAPIYAGLTQPSKAGPVWTGKIAVNESTMLAPLRRKKPTMYFVNSMSDLFHESVPDEVIDRVFAVMALCPQHTFQLLTKRSDRMRSHLATPFDRTGVMIAAANISQQTQRFLDFPTFPLPNVWLGVSVEDQKRADERIPDLLATPAAMRFLSCEPLLGPVDLLAYFDPTGACCGGEPEYRCENCPSDAPWRYSIPSDDGQWAFDPTIDWVIVGGESGPRARPMHPDWARELRDQCAAAGVPFFFKQWGEFAPGEIAGEFLNPGRRAKGLEYWDGRWQECWSEVEGHCDDEPDLYQVGKKRAGRTLDGVTHDAMPQVQANA